MSKQNKSKSSAAPLAIIVIVLVIVIAGFAWLYSTSKPDTPGTNTNLTKASPTQAKATPGIPADAPPGAALGINMLGQPTAAVSIEEFADFQCPSCASAYPVMKEIEAAYAGNKNVRFIFRHYPLPMHDKSYDAATVVEAAGMQGGPKFWAMMDQIFTNQQTWANNPNYKEIWKSYAEKIGLNVDQWQSDSAGLGTRGRIDMDIQRARGIGVSSTPSVYINGRLIPFSDVNVPTMKQIIDAELENTSKAAGGQSIADPSTKPNSNSAGNSSAEK